MPTPGILVAAMAVALLVVGAQKAVHGAKKVGHQIGCVVTKGHRCPPKLPSPGPPKVEHHIDRCRAEIASAERSLRSGHPDIAGLCLALADWSTELRIIEGRAWKNESSSF